MRAFLNRIDEKGVNQIGGTNATVSGEYKTRNGIIKWARKYMDKNWPGCGAKLEIHINWETRYKTDDRNTKFITLMSRT